MAKTNSTPRLVGEVPDSTAPEIIPAFNPLSHHSNEDSPTDAAAALRFLAAVCGQPRESLLNDEESYGMEVLLKLIADKVEGGAS